MARHSTVVIESRFLVREALSSLMTSQGYKVIASISSTSDIPKVVEVAASPALVILGSLVAEEASLAASGIRMHWRRAKIVHLYETPSSADSMKLLASEIDGCIPLFASKEVLVDACRKILSEDFRILMLKTERVSSACAMGVQEAAGPNLVQVDPILVDETEDRTVPRRIPCGLSHREEEILKGLTRGHSNKIIARTCGISEATIKVHMKSILRKAQVSNRTQAAIWALEKGYHAAA